MALVSSGEGEARDRSGPVQGLLDQTRGGWPLVGLLMLIQVVSYVDRFLPSLLSAPLKRDLHLSDFQLGLLLGPAFAVFYVAVGLPFGWAADRFSRRGILAFGITVWSVMTSLAGLATAFLPLFAARLGVGFGEAAVAPCAISMISDRFDARRRPRAVSLYMAGSFIGAGSAFLFGGPLVALIQSAAPLGHAVRPWQATFMILGVPGLLLSAAVLLVREPARSGAVQTSGGSLTNALGYVLKNWRAFGVVFVGSSAMVTLGSLSLWNVALFQRTWGWRVAETGVATGLLFLTAGPLGTVIGIWLTQRWARKGTHDATLRALLSGLALAAPGFMLYPLAPSAPIALAGLFLAFTGQSMATAAGPAALTFLAPGRIRSQATALYYLVISIAGQLLGPPPVGLMVDLFKRPEALRYAVSIEAVSVSAPALLVIFLGMKAYRSAAKTLAADEGELSG